MKQIQLVPVILLMKQNLNKVTFCIQDKLILNNFKFIDIPISNEITNSKDLLNALLSKEEDDIGEFFLNIKKQIK
jgi:hypothetical protein